MLHRRTFLHLSAVGLAGLYPPSAFAQEKPAARGKPTQFLIACMTLPYSQFPLERALTGMKKGQSKHVEVEAVDGYSAYDMKKRVSVEKAKLPDGLKVGDLLQSPDGQLVTVLKIEEAQALLDLNHPLAGKNLTFDVKVLNVEKTEAGKADHPTK